MFPVFAVGNSILRLADGEIEAPVSQSCKSGGPGIRMQMSCPSLHRGFPEVLNLTCRATEKPEAKGNGDSYEHSSDILLRFKPSEKN